MLPRDASEQVLSDILTKKKEEPNIGDIIFFKTNSKVNHVGLYINNREFIHSSGYVKINSINKESQYYSENLDINLYPKFKNSSTYSLYFLGYIKYLLYNSLNFSLIV